ncbi:MAG: hypothetical protein CMO44_16065 [Verrucomicrobiales bacterium]|nr:hypothetical protein [Verrucomicrobiales bacterium]|tara:strand:- start:2151 stop:2915 length:765 start_codon:yes stop_codon:yes gene_type:complete
MPNGNRGKKNMLTKESEPVLRLLMEEYIEKGMTDKEKFYAYRSMGYDIANIGTIRRWRQKFGYTNPIRPRDSVTGNQILGEIEDEIWKPIVTDQYDASPYKISQYGNIMGKKGKKLKWSSMNGYAGCQLSLSYDDFKGSFIPKSSTGLSVNNDYKYGKQVKVGVKPHIFVAEHFLPKPVPLCFSELWHTLNAKQQKWIQSVYIIDHIDDNGLNPHVDNLRWVTPYENNHRVKKERATGENAKLKEELLKNNPQE